MTGRAVTDARATPAPRPRRRWPWIVAVLVVVALAAAAWFAGEAIARGIVERTIRDQIAQRLALPAGQQVDVDIPGAVLPQLIAGRFDEITISGADVPLSQAAGQTGGAAQAGGAELTGDVVVRASGVPVRGEGEMTDATASVTLDQAQLQQLLSSVDEFPASTVALDEPDVEVTAQLRVLAVTVPVGVGLSPSAADGELVLTPRTLQVAGAEVSADALLDQFGAVASTVIRDWDVCVASYLPSGMTLTGVRVAGQTLVADFSIDGGILRDEALQQKGTCA